MWKIDYKPSIGKTMFCDDEDGFTISFRGKYLVYAQEPLNSAAERPKTL